MRNKIIDLFCGCGGLSLGFEEAGFETVLGIDLWKDAVTTFNHNIVGNVAICDDINNITNDKLKKMNENREIVGVIGGPPCQGYSTVGTRNINDPRNHLYLEYCRVVEYVKPDFFLLENVKGLLTLSKGLFKEDILSRFRKMGYNVTYAVLNAAHYGVPQNRERIFFVGMRGKEFVFPQGNKCNMLTCKDAIGDLPKSPEEANNNEYVCLPQNNYQEFMRAGSDGIKNHVFTIHTEQTKKIIGMIPNGGNIKDLPESYWNIRKYNKAFERMNSDKPSNTVDTGHRNYFHYSENRIPTVRENARLQSFPDKFEIIGTRTSQYKQIGNAVPPRLANAIALAIKQELGDD